jgi:molecular chaperone GrpE
MNGDISSHRLALRLRRQHRWDRAENHLALGERFHEATYELHKAEAVRQFGHLKEQLIRTQAEFDNFRKRIRRDLQQQMDLANKDLIEGLLPVLDNFERALTSPGQSVEGLLGGLQMVQKQLIDILGQAGLERIEALGQPFDPNVHEAVATAQAEGVPDNHVMDVLQPGYLLKGRLIRPAMVRVARG